MVRKYQALPYYICVSSQTKTQSRHSPDTVQGCIVHLPSINQRFGCVYHHLSICGRTVTLLCPVQLCTDDHLTTVHQPAMSSTSSHIMCGGNNHHDDGGNKATAPQTPRAVTIVIHRAEHRVDILLRVRVVGPQWWAGAGQVGV